MTDLNWALAHMESKSKRRIADGVVDLVREAKPKGEKEYVSLWHSCKVQTFAVPVTKSD